MRFNLSFLLILIFFQNIISNEDNLLRMERAALTLRNFVKYKREAIRKLQGSDEPEIMPNTIPPELPEDIKKDAEETLAEKEPIYGNVEMPPTIETTPPQNSTTPTTPKSTVVQVKKFHKFERNTKTKALKFGVFFYFLNKPIVRTIIMRLTIKYKTRRLRNLEEVITGETTPTTCLIKKEYEDKIGKPGNGDNIDYDCTAETTSDAQIDTAKIDPTKPMVIGNDITPVAEIEFNEDSKDGTENLVTIKDTEVAVFEITDHKVEDKKLILTGTLKPESALNINDQFPMNFTDIENNEIKKIYCQVINKNPFTLECDTTNNPLKTNYGNLTLSTSDTDKLYLSINIPTNADRNQEINTNPTNNAYYKKNSSGLSGGAIAGIVIACVVVLAAASIAAIMLRKPSPPIDNTTVVGLKTVENI